MWIWLTSELSSSDEIPDPSQNTALIALGVKTTFLASLLYDKKPRKHIKLINAAKTQPIKKLLSDENRYKGDKNIILRAIEEKDWEILEELLRDESIKDFPDLIKMIEEALKNKWWKII